MATTKTTRSRKDIGKEITPEEQRRIDKHQAEEAAALREQEQWIIDYGSEHLKMAAAEGYHHSGLYVRERAAQDFPGFINIQDRVKGFFHDRGNPSFAALQSLREQENHIKKIYRNKAHQPAVRIVWLNTEAARSMECGNRMGDEPFPIFRQGEYLLISGYLGKQTLVQQMDCRPELRQQLQQLELLIQTGIPILVALNTLQETNSNSRLMVAWESVDATLRKGKGICEGMEQHPDIFPITVRQMVNAGEAAGMLDVALHTLQQDAFWQ